LEKNLDTFDVTMPVVLEAAQDLGRIAVKEIKVCQIHGNDIVGFHLKLAYDLFEQKGVVKEHFTLDVQVRSAVLFPLCDLGRHATH
jgi:hypothetical protein